MPKLAAHDLKLQAYRIRLALIKTLSQAGSGHTAGSLGITDIITTLYFNILNHDPKNPSWEERDRFILSAGHLCPALYTVLAFAGYFPRSELASLRKLGSRLQGHPERHRLPGLETTSGPLGCGLAQAAGIALSAKLDHRRFRIFCLTSDGEHDEGNHWEAVLFAAKYALSNLTVFIDRNSIQLSGNTEEILPLEPLSDKYHAFNWHVLEIDGHDFTQILGAVAQARANPDQPTVIVANTTPGKGVSFIENDYLWHGRVPTSAQADQAAKELTRTLKELETKNA